MNNENILMLTRTGSIRKNNYQILGSVRCLLQPQEALRTLSKLIQTLMKEIHNSSVCAKAKDTHNK